MKYKAIAAIFYFAMASLAGSSMAATSSKTIPLSIGVAWYPEQWPESRWEDDLTLMEKAHVHWVRVGEFAWSRMEPSEGVYDLDWLVRAVELAGKHHIFVVMGTPSASPPAWLTQKYPETLRTKEDGRKDEHGNRQQFDWSSPKYRELARAMAERLAVRFGHDPNVIGWQIDNEYAEQSFGPTTRTQFQQWLKARYGTLDNLNQRWATSYWSQSYTAWEQIPVGATRGNPGLMLSWQRFVSDTWRSYQKVQIDAIRAHSEPRQFITTNMMGFFDRYDHYTVAQDLDFAAWDDYVGQGHLDPTRNGAAHDLTRGFLRKNFWVMETQPGFVNWSQDNNALDKGEVRAMAWHDVAHGADAVGYWQWRSALNGQEEYHGTLIGSDGTPVPVYSEVAQVGAEFDRAAAWLSGTEPQAEVAILHSYDSRWAVNWQRHNQSYDPVDALLSYYKQLRRQAHTVDIVAPLAPLSRYKLVVAPALNVLSDGEAKNLIEYVRQGGHLVLGQRSGMKTVDNALQPQRQPGPLTELLGGRVEQYYALESPVPLDGQWGSGSSKLWAEQLGASAPDTEVLMRYGRSNGWLDGQPAAITRRVGNGRITYIGAWLDGMTMSHAVEWMLTDAKVRPVAVDVPEGVEFSIRRDAQHEVWIFVNLNAGAQRIKLPQTMTDVLHGGNVNQLSLDHFDVSVLSSNVP
ncbi:beta-galactosidase [Granulicella cerasi]|uniref:beta-galactosidase n=1 Tax=Granulicella cerasi TaxID=741063 RepID=UPI0021E02166|nr:beta-galactosidase [Granulicella cerasi]